MAPHVLNAVTIDILVEQPRAEFDLLWLFPKNTFEQFMEQRDLMVPRFFDPEKRKVLLSIHTYVIRTKHHTILFDTCCGNHKERAASIRSTWSTPRIWKISPPWAASPKTSTL